MCGLQRPSSIPPQGLSMGHCQGLEGLLLCPSLLPQLLASCQVNSQVPSGIQLKRRFLQEAFLDSQTEIPYFALSRHLEILPQSTDS